MGTSQGQPKRPSLRKSRTQKARKAASKKNAPSFLVLVRGGLRHLLVLPTLTFNILFRPTWTGANIIRHDDRKALLRALKYYSEIFAFAFLIYAIANQFQLYEGNSEWRSFVEIIIQLLIAIPIIYLLCLALPERIPFLTVTQAVLYVDGVFLLTAAVVSIPISYLDFKFGIPSANRELDIFATEYERCLSHNSIFYWLMRGDLQFFLYVDRWKPQDWANWLFDNFNYVVIIPFLAIFALMLRPKRKISFVLICLFAGIAFIITVAGSDLIKPRLTFLIAAKDTKCTYAHLDQIVNKYAPNLIARQIAYKINNDSLRTKTYVASLLSVPGTTDLIVRAQLKPDAELTWQLQATFPLLFRQSYCSDANPYWIAARRINSRILFVVYDKDGSTPLYNQVSTPKDCPAWPTGGATAWPTNDASK